MSTTTTTCPRCASPVLDSDIFCEGCGMQLRDDAPTAHNARGRRELDAGAAGAVSDRGLVHHRNEDSFFVSVAPDRVVAVVCDGVSTSVAPDVAARVAADTAGGVLRDVLGTHDEPVTMRAAIDAARRTVLSIPWASGRGRHAPSCTLVGVVYDGQAVTIGSVGDSRAYWVADDSAAALTRDDSWAAEQIAAGNLTESEAASDPRSHMITSWLGADAPTEPPQIVTFVPRHIGRIVLCSDGLWNSAPAPQDIAALVREHAPSTSAVQIARALTDFAVAAGGHDNITVAVVDVPYRDRQEARKP